MADRNLGDISPSNYTFTYKSKCADVKKAMTQLTNLQNYCLNEDLVILYLEAVTIPIDTDFEISISLLIKLDNPKKRENIVKRFYGFSVYLESLSRK
jgi:hypothetical protein